jgi:hypothetical protein
MMMIHYQFLIFYVRFNQRFLIVLKYHIHIFINEEKILLYYLQVKVVEYLYAYKKIFFFLILK